LIFIYVIRFVKETCLFKKKATTWRLSKNKISQSVEKMWNAFKKQSCPKCRFHQLGTRCSQFYSSTKMMARRYACAKIISRGAKYLRMAASVSIEVTSEMIFPDPFSDVIGDNFLIHVQTSRFNF